MYVLIHMYAFLKSDYIVYARKYMSIIFFNEYISTLNFSPILNSFKIQNSFYPFRNS
jgi:hypothetical protein